MSERSHLVILISFHLFHWKVKLKRARNCADFNSLTDTPKSIYYSMSNPTVPEAQSGPLSKATLAIVASCFGRICNEITEQKR